MAITGSGSLAISLSVFVISAAFLPKGESPHLFARLARACGGVAGSVKAGEETMSGGRSCGAFARRDARQLRLESQHHFLRAAVDFTRSCCRFQRWFFGVVVMSSSRGDSGKK